MGLGLAGFIFSEASVKTCLIPQILVFFVPAIPQALRGLFFELSCMGSPGDLCQDAGVAARLNPFAAFDGDAWPRPAEVLAYLPLDLWRCC